MGVKRVSTLTATLGGRPRPTGSPVPLLTAMPPPPRRCPPPTGPVVSMTRAPSATPRGDAGRVLSRWSRRATASAPSSGRRRARSSPTAVRYTFTSASGKHHRADVAALDHPATACSATQLRWRSTMARAHLAGWPPPPTPPGSPPGPGWPRSRRRRPTVTRSPTPRCQASASSATGVGSRPGRSPGRGRPRPPPGTWPRCPAGRAPAGRPGPGTRWTCPTRRGRRWR